MCQLAAGLKGCLIRNADDFVIDRSIECLRNKAGADALDLVRAGSSAGENRRGIRLCTNDLHIGVFLLQIFADAAQSSAGADTGNEHINLTVCILPDLRTGCLIMRLGICRVIKLSEDDRAGYGGLELFSLGDGALHALCALCQNQLRAIGLKKRAALHAHGVRKRQDGMIALGRSHRSQSDTGVAAGGLDDGGAGL